LPASFIGEECGQYHLAHAARRACREIADTRVERQSAYLANDS
jgi:hypothetical protein